MASDANARSRARRHPLHTGWGRAAASSNARGTIGHNQQPSETIGHNQQQSGEGNNWAQSAAISSNQDHKQRLARPSWPITAITANINQRWFWVDQHPAPPPSNGSSGLISPPAPKSKRSVCPPAGPCARRSSRLDHDAVRWLPNSLSPHQQVPARPPIPLCPRPLRA